MKSIALALGLLVVVSTQTEGQAGRIQGAWSVDEVVYTGPNARTVSDPQPGFIIFTARHYARVEVTSDAPRPAPASIATATADELRAVWSPFGANAGTYEVSGAELTIRPTVAKNPAVMAAGSFTVYRYRMEGDALWLTAVRNSAGPIQNPTTVRFRRAE